MAKYKFGDGRFHIRIQNVRTVYCKNARLTVCIVVKNQRQVYIYDNFTGELNE